MKNSKIYLDYASATPLDKSVDRAMKPYFADKFYNPSAIYLDAKKVKSDIDQARAEAAKVLGARPSEIIFCAGGTEANNLAITGVMSKYPKSNLVISAIEHESVRAPALKNKVKEAPVNKQGIVDVDRIKKLIDDKTVLVSVILANNEIGTIQPIREIARIVEGIRKMRQKNGNALPIYLHTDACQAGNYLDIHVSRLGVDMMTLNGGKIYGPKQSGVLYVRTGVILDPIILGGGQERGLRSGTENTPSIVGFARALGLAQKNRTKETMRMQNLQKLFFDKLSKIPQIMINGSTKQRLPNNIHITVPGFDNERLMMELDEKGIMCATGSACSASKEESSHVLRAIGLSDEDARASLRFTMGRETSEKDIKHTVDALAKIIA